MNIEFLLLIIDYFRVIKRRDFLLDWLFPLVFALIFFFINVDNNELFNKILVLSSNALSLLGILIGFSIAVITLLITANTKNIDEIKEVIVIRVNEYRTVSLFELMIITYSYSVIIEIILVIFNLFIPSLKLNTSAYCLTTNVIASIDILFILHVLFVTIRNITSFYFILIKK